MNTSLLLISETKIRQAQKAIGRQDEKIRPYSKSELAQAYAPEITSQAALNRLAAWIRLNRPLTEALRQTGYYTKQRLFTSRQVALIFEYLGEP